ncbi:hypothetical protein KGM_210345 [Danaus plexippus plexippus]|uniref:Uncharacterized protein n=1 Tax=Danaus plexippus plexippus TaxID=278856 RepID=A0A212F9X1_DANPL|nr:hypothetical protein KGM_210345 [Danaus plexippus plexippus]
MASKAVTLENLNPNIIKLEYAVRGPLVIRAGEIEKELEKSVSGALSPLFTDTTTKREYECNDHGQCDDSY